MQFFLESAEYVGLPCIVHYDFYRNDGMLKLLNLFQGLKTLQNSKLTLAT